MWDVGWWMLCYALIGNGRVRGVSRKNGKLAVSGVQEAVLVLVLVGTIMFLKRMVFYSGNWYRLKPYGKLHNKKTEFGKPEPEGGEQRGGDTDWSLGGLLVWQCFACMVPLARLYLNCSVKASMRRLESVFNIWGVWGPSLLGSGRIPSSSSASTCEGSNVFS